MGHNKDTGVERPVFTTRPRECPLCVMGSYKDYNSSTQYIAADVPLAFRTLNDFLGMGRNSSRIASRRIASNSREPTSYAGLLSDDEDDADWAGGPLPSERRKRKIKSNNSRKPSKVHKYVAKNLIKHT